MTYRYSWTRRSGGVGNGADLQIVIPKRRNGTVGSSCSVIGSERWIRDGEALTIDDQDCRSGAMAGSWSEMTNRKA